MNKYLILLGICILGISCNQTTPTSTKETVKDTAILDTNKEFEEMKNFWNERYASEEYVYGEAPNLFFKEQINKLKEGSILMPAEGEGRNAVYAAAQGWNVEAFDISIEGKEKAMRLAEKYGCAIQYTVGEFSELTYKDEQFDAIGLIYAHFPGHLKSGYHKALIPYLKPGGIIILEAFSKKQVLYQQDNPQAGGPKDTAVLFSVEEIKNDFSEFDILILEEVEVELDEGPYHKGKGSVVRFLGKKK